MTTSDPRGPSSLGTNVVATSSVMTAEYGPKASSSSSLSLALSITTTSMTSVADSRRQAEAAAARRKRRRVLRRQQSSNKKKIATPLSLGSSLEAHQHDELTVVPRNLFLSSHDPYYRLQFHLDIDHNNFTRKPVVIPPTVAGLQQVVTRFEQGEVVAIPTECTYEMVISLSMDRAADFVAITKRGIRRALEESPRSYYPGNDTRLSPPHDHHDDAHLYSSYSISNEVPPLSSAMAWKPHIYLPHPPKLWTLAAMPVLYQFFPCRTYACRSPHPGKVMAVHSFSETMAVLKLLAAKLWPGPVVMHAAIHRPSAAAIEATMTTSPGTNAESQENVLSAIFSSRHGRDYVALRCPSHPLTVKVVQEHSARHRRLPRKRSVGISGPLVNTCLTPTTPTRSPTVSSPSSPSSLTSPLSTKILSTREADYSPSSSATVQSPVLTMMDRDDAATTRGQGGGGSLRTTPHRRGLASSCSNTSIGRGHRASSSLLIGCPLAVTHQRNDSNMDFDDFTTVAFITKASQVSGTVYPVAVLDGENQQEIFSVPTCEIGRTFPSSIWIDASRRIITVRHEGGGDDDRIADASRSQYRPQCDRYRALLSSEALSEALRFHPKTVKQRILQAVLLKWRVVVENVPDDASSTEREGF